MLSRERQVCRMRPRRLTLGVRSSRNLVRLPEPLCACLQHSILSFGHRRGVRAGHYTHVQKASTFRQCHVWTDIALVSPMI